MTAKRVENSSGLLYRIRMQRIIKKTTYESYQTTRGSRADQQQFRLVFAFIVVDCRHRS